MSLYSLSKAYGFASWRIGYMIAPEALLESIKKTQDTILICAPVISQFAAVGALRAGPEFCREKIAQIASVRELVLQELKAAAEFCSVPAADGAFYFLVRVKTSLSPMELTERLVREHRVAVIPGNAFGFDKDCFVRLAYGVLDRATASEAVGRFVRGVKDICKTNLAKCANLNRISH